MIHLFPGDAPTFTFAELLMAGALIFVVGATFLIALAATTDTDCLVVPDEELED